MSNLHHSLVISKPGFQVADFLFLPLNRLPQSRVAARKRLVVLVLLPDRNQQAHQRQQGAAAPDRCRPMLLLKWLGYELGVHGIFGLATHKTLVTHQTLVNESRFSFGLSCRSLSNSIRLVNIRVCSACAFRFS